jgi:ubiquitin C-terminal hydrolase
MFLSIDGGCSRIFNSGSSQGVRRQRFLALMVGAPGSPARHLPHGPSSMFISIDGGRSQIYNSDTSQEAQRFLAFIVSTLRSTAPTPPKGPVVDVS